MQASQNYSFTYSSLKVFLALLIVVFILYFLFYVLKKINLNKLSGFGREFEIISRYPLGDRNYLLVVRLYGKKYLLGVSQNSISNLGELDIDEFGEKEKEKGEMSFSSILNKVIKKEK